MSIGIIGHTIFIVTQEYGTMYSSAQTGLVATLISPAFTLIFAMWLLKKKKNYYPQNLIYCLSNSRGIINCRYP